LLSGISPCGLLDLARKKKDKKRVRKTSATRDGTPVTQIGTEVPSVKEPEAPETLSLVPQAVVQPLEATLVEEVCNLISVGSNQIASKRVKSFSL
jgi:hypothetical protein